MAIQSTTSQAPKARGDEIDRRLIFWMNLLFVAGEGILGLGARTGLFFGLGGSVRSRPGLHRAG
jgi:hypothetical protein